MTIGTFPVCKRAVLHRIQQRGLWPAVAIVAGSAGCGVGGYSAVNLLQLRSIKLVTLQAELRVFTQQQVRPGRHMPGVTGAAFPRLRGLMRTA